MFCPSCGNEIPDNSKFCDHCGAETVGAAKPPSDEPKPKEEAWTSDTMDTESPSDKETMPVVSTTSSGSREFKPRNGKFNTVEWLKEGLEIVKADLATFIVFFLVYSIAYAVLGVTGIGILAMPGILAGCMFVLIAHLRRKEPLDIGKMFSSGWDFYVDMLVFWIIGGILTGIGLCILIVPGLIICMAFWIASFLIIDKKAKFGEAMNAAFALISSQAVGLLVFYLILLVIGFVLGIIVLIPILGAMVVFAASLIISPVVMIASYKAYMEFFGEE